MISIQTHDFRMDEQYQQLRQDSPKIGAIVTFTGLVREFYPADSTGLYLEHYPKMAEHVLERIIQTTKQRWPIHQARIIHRIGQLALGEQIVFVGISSAHRGDAFAAGEYIMDRLKTEAPFWKKEIGINQSHWVEAKHSDCLARQKWDKSTSSSSKT